MQPNLYLSGLAPDGMPRTLVQVPGFWDHMHSDQARGGRGDFYLPEVERHMRSRGAVSALVQLDQVDVSGARPRVVRRIFTHNVLTDNGAQALLKGLFNSNQTIGQYMVLDTNAAVAQLNASITANATATTSALTVLSGGNPTAVSGNKASAFKNNATQYISGIPALFSGGNPTTPGYAVFPLGASNGIAAGIVTLPGSGYGSAPTAYLQTTAAGSGVVLGTVTLSAGALATVPVTTAGSAYTLTAQNGAAQGGASDPTTGGGIVVSYGTANADYTSGETASASTGTSIALLNAHTFAHAHAINDYVVANPQTGDGPTSLPGTAIMYNSGSSTNAATGTAIPATVSGTGIGKRQALFSATFSSTSTAATYNNLWIGNQSTIAALTAAADYLTHLSFSNMVISSSFAIAVSYTIFI